MLINKNIKRQKVYYEVYRLVSLINDWNLPDLDIKILSLLLDRYMTLKDKFEKDILIKLFLTKDIKDRMIIELDTSYNTFMNSLTRLKKNGLLLPKTLLPNPKLAFIPNKDFMKLTVQLNFLA